MSAAAARDPRPLLVRLFARWNGLLALHVPPGVAPLLRLEQGAGLVHGERGEIVAGALEPLLACAAPRLALPPPALTAVAVRPKLRVALGRAGAGLTVTLRYFGVPPSEADLGAAFAAHPSRSCVFAPRVDDGEVCLQAIADEPAMRYSVVHVLAGRRPLALPMSSVLRADPADVVPETLARAPSLARLLDLEEAAVGGRPAVLVLRRRPEPAALRVESLVGHGAERVLPVGPLLHDVPWLLGCIAREEGAPVLVVDPLALLAARPSGD